MKTSIATLATLVACLLGGCNQSSNPPVAEAPANNPAPTQGPTTFRATAAQFESPTTETPPDNIVNAFLTALRDGDQQTASALLTAKARAETAKHELAVQPPGAPTAQFKIGQVEFVRAPQNGETVGAHVTSTWTENDDQGNRLEYEVVWALRHDSDGWRIAGLATPISPNEAPVFLNFEDPADMLAKQRQAQQIVAENEQIQRIQQARPQQQNPSVYR